MASHVQGPLITLDTPSFALPMSFYGTALAAASGTIIPKWRAVLPPYPTTLYSIGMVFTRGGTTPPQGGTMSVKVWSGDATAKGLYSASVAGATAESVLLTKTAAVTLPASGHVQLAVAAVGATSPGRGAMPALWLGFRRA